MKILLDMNISPMWAEVLKELGWEALHWSDVGAYSASDIAILGYAKQHGFVVLTHDLDFSAILAVTGAHAPSVIQLRTQDLVSERFRDTLVAALRQFQSELENGALIVVDEIRSRVRVLPLK